MMDGRSALNVAKARLVSSSFSSDEVRIVLDRVSTPLTLQLIPSVGLDNHFV